MSLIPSFLKEPRDSTWFGLVAILLFQYCGCASPLESAPGDAKPSDSQIEEKHEPKVDSADDVPSGEEGEETGPDPNAACVAANVGRQEGGAQVSFHTSSRYCEDGSLNSPGECVRVSLEYANMPDNNLGCEHWVPNVTAARWPTGDLAVQRILQVWPGEVRRGCTVYRQLVTPKFAFPYWIGDTGGFLKEDYFQAIASPVAAPDGSLWGVRFLQLSEQLVVDDREFGVELAFSKAYSWTGDWESCVGQRQASLTTFALPRARWAILPCRFSYQPASAAQLCEVYDWSDFVRPVKESTPVVVDLSPIAVACHDGGPCLVLGEVAGKMRLLTLEQPGAPPAAQDVHSEWLNKKTRLFSDGSQMWWIGQTATTTAVGLVANGAFSVAYTWEGASDKLPMVVARDGKVAVLDGATLRVVHANGGLVGCLTLSEAPTSLLADGCGTFYLSLQDRYWAIRRGFDGGSLWDIEETSLHYPNNVPLSGWTLSLTDSFGLVALTPGQNAVWLVQNADSCDLDPCGWSGPQGGASGRNVGPACAPP